MNNFTGVGRMTADADLRYTAQGKAVANFRIAINRPFKNQQGENEADFINAVTWGKQAENLAQYMSKGSRIGIVGRLQTRTYENKNGQTVYVTEVFTSEIQFLESKQQQDRPSTQPATNPQYQNAQNQSPFKQEGQQVNITDEDLPF